MARYSDKQKAALDALMKDDVYAQAMMIISDEDLSALTMERLATKVGVSRGTLYNYFADRDAVVDYLEERTFAPVLRAINDVADNDLDPEEKLTKIASWIFTAIYNDRALVMALAPTIHSGANRTCHEARRGMVRMAIAKVVEEGIKAQVFEELEPSLVSEFFLGAISGKIDSMSFQGKFLKSNEVVPTLMQLVLGGIRKTS